MGLAPGENKHNNLDLPYSPQHSSVINPVLQQSGVVSPMYLICHPSPSSPSLPIYARVYARFQGCQLSRRG